MLLGADEAWNLLTAWEIAQISYSCRCFADPGGLIGLETQLEIAALIRTIFYGDELVICALFTNRISSGRSGM